MASGKVRHHRTEGKILEGAKYLMADSERPTFT